MNIVAWFHHRLGEMVMPLHIVRFVEYKLTYTDRCPGCEKIHKKRIIGYVHSHHLLVCY